MTTLKRLLLAVALGAFMAAMLFAMPTGVSWV